MNSHDSAERKAIGTFWCPACREHFSDCGQRTVFIDSVSKQEVFCSECGEKITLLKDLPKDIQQKLL